MRRLGAEEIDAVIARQGVGVLALSKDGVPYALPMSYGYDPDRATFFVMFGADGRKTDYVDANDVASLAVVEREDPTWRSILVRGAIEPVPKPRERRALAGFATTATFPADLEVWGDRLQETELELYELDVEEVSGRAFEP